MDHIYRECLADECHLCVVVECECEFTIRREVGEWVTGGALLTAHLIIDRWMRLASEKIAQYKSGEQLDYDQ